MHYSSFADGVWGVRGNFCADEHTLLREARLAADHPALVEAYTVTGMDLRAFRMDVKEPDAIKDDSKEVPF
eukprot:5036674-Pyramimonas_sp.AAC.2